MYAFLEKTIPARKKVRYSMELQDAIQLPVRLFLRIE
jgi:hypothetical protein